jgi:hypothetical protein
VSFRRSKSHLKLLPVAFLCLGAVMAALPGCARRSSITAPGGIVLRSQRISLPTHGREFSGGPQAAVANTYCLMCHSGGMVATQPPLGLAQWQAEMHKMIKTYGCPLPEGNVDELAAFIAHAGPNLAATAP